MKLGTYRNSFLFDVLIQIPEKIANSEISKFSKPPKLFSLRLGGERYKTLKTA